MGALSTWSPFRELERIARRWESPLPRLFEDFEDNFDEAFTPAVESYVKDGNLVVRADVPGLEPKDLEVSVLGNVLTIKGERKSEQEVKKEDYLRREVSYGAFERRMSLPEGTATDKMRASFKNGVVEITVPLAKETMAKKVQIETPAEKKVEISKQ
jgi:HSP20 family protein